MAADLRKHAAFVVDARSVDEHLSAVAGAYPDLVAMVRELIPRQRVVRAVRYLLEEGVALLSARPLLERLLDAELAGVADAELGQFVREGMQLALAGRFGRGGRTLVAYLLDADIERTLVAAQPEVPAEFAERLAAAVRQELSSLPEGVTPPALITSTAARRRLRDLLVGEFPRVAVLGYGELPADLKVQPLGRIGWTQSVS